jgi:hypothetical protein
MTSLAFGSLRAPASRSLAETPANRIAPEATGPAGNSQRPRVFSGASMP